MFFRVRVANGPEGEKSWKADGQHLFVTRFDRYM